MKYRLYLIIGTKKSIALISILLGLFSSCSNDHRMENSDPINYEEMIGTVPAFPGAEGHGRYVTGGRGGEIRHVTNLNDHGDGSLRNAVSGDTKKIIVFDIAGYIDLDSMLEIGPNTTIFGQTSPGEGITLRYKTVNPVSDNVIIRFLRFRMGNIDSLQEDCIWTRHHSNIIIDHCSMSWSIDELASFYDNNNFTMQWCILGEALRYAGHYKGGEHSYGGIWGGKNASFHHNFLLHMQNRIPRLNGARYNWQGYNHNKYANTIEAERVDLRNCVMYNWGKGIAYGGDGGGYHNIINNYYKAGPATKNKTIVFQCSACDSKNSDGIIPDGVMGKFYVRGNYVTAAGEEATDYDWKGVITDPGYEGSLDTLKIYEPIDPGIVTTHRAEIAFEKVLTYAGASFSRDDVDRRYVNDALIGTATFFGSNTKESAKLPGIIDTPNDCGGWPNLNQGRRAIDSDNDGIPDEWERENGLNPNDSEDALSYSLDPKHYYQNIEVYANSMVQDIMQSENTEADQPVDEYYPPCKIFR